MKKVLFFIFIVVSFFIINNLVRSIITLWQKQDLVVVAEHDLEAKKRENQVLKQQISRVESLDFVEEQARRKLLLAKQGENEVILPKDTEATQGAKLQIDTRANWQKWVDLFF